MKMSRLFDYFPPPKFLNIPYAGLSISDSAVRVIQFGRKNGKYYVMKYAERSLTKGLITGGEVKNKAELTQIISSLKKEMDLDYVKVSVPEEKAYLFSAKIRIVPEKQVRSEVEQKIEENVPVPPGELLFDYKVVDSTQSDFLRVVVSNLPINMAEDYVEIVTEAGLRPFSLEIESQAIVRSLVKAGDSNTVLVVNFAKDKAGLFIANKRIVHFTSTIQMKGDPESDLDLLSHEIKKLYGYWHSLKENIDKPEKKIQEIIICGENISETILPYLSTHQNTKATLANVWVNSFDIDESVPQIDFMSSLKYPAAIGLALPSDTLI
ncbi:MAG: pilus assembly protein PilM [Minisyncoccia bacterium]